MAHEILSVKLCELEDQLSKLDIRIHLSEIAGHMQLQQEIKALTNECTETELTLQRKLQMSRAGIVADLADTYREIEQIIHANRLKHQEQIAGKNDPDTAAEEKILLAEYALDFAVLAANRALLLSMEAVDAQLMQQERRTS